MTIQPDAAVGEPNSSLTHRWRTALDITTDLDERLLGSLVELYLDLHRHPELSGAEVRTAGVLAAWLEDCGYEVTSGVGGHGVVGVLRNGPGPVVLLRTELDGLPVRERTGLRWASTEQATRADGVREPVMHACGHDAHVAAVAGAATLLAGAASQWHGTVLVVGQPAEETLSGAAAMLADGLYRRWPRPAVALAQHIGPAPVGTVLHCSGPVTAGAAFIEVRFDGRGGHGAMPELSPNPVLAAAALALAVQHAFGAPDAAPADRPERVVATVGALQGGSRPNVIPETATVSIGVRSLSDTALDAAVAQVAALAERACAEHGCSGPPEVRVTARVPVHHNDEAAAARVRRAHLSALGPGRVLATGPSMAAEDFPLLGSATPADGTGTATVYWAVGSTGAGQWAAAAGPGATVLERLAALPVNHSARFAPDPVPTLRTAVTAMATAAWTFLADPDG
jgi:amidohydrolase